MLRAPCLVYICTGLISQDRQGSWTGFCETCTRKQFRRGKHSGDTFSKAVSCTMSKALSKAGTTDAASHECIYIRPGAPMRSGADMHFPVCMNRGWLQGIQVHAIRSFVDKIDSHTEPNLLLMHTNMKKCSDRHAPSEKVSVAHSQ